MALILPPFCNTWYLNTPKLSGKLIASGSGKTSTSYPSGIAIDTLLTSFQGLTKSTGNFLSSNLKGFLCVVKNK